MLQTMCMLDRHTVSEIRILVKALSNSLKLSFPSLNNKLVQRISKIRKCIFNYTCDFGNMLMLGRYNILFTISV